MSKSRRSGRLSATNRRELEIAAAVAREAVLQVHVERALELVRHADGRAAPLRMLDIYIRIHALEGSLGEVVLNRALATLGRGPGGGAVHAAAEGAERLSLLSILGRRLRGRVNASLRRAVELHTGVTQAALLDTHVRHAHGFYRILADAHTIEAACTMYLERVNVAKTLAPVIYMMVLDRIAAEELPRTWEPAVHSPLRPPAARPPSVETRTPRSHPARRPA